MASDNLIISGVVQASNQNVQAVIRATQSGGVYTLIVSGGAGDVAGPSSSTDNAVVLFDGTTGLLIKNSTAILTSGLFSVAVAFKALTTVVASLPAAATAGVGARAFVTDASTTLILGLGLTVVGSGGNKVPVYSDGTNWIIG